MKRFLSIAVSTMMALAVLAGCGSGTKPTASEKTSTATESAAPTAAEPAAEQTLNIAIFEGGYGVKYWNKVIEEFTAQNPGVKINITSNPEIGNVIRPQILAGNPPDFIYLPSTNASGIAQALIKDKALADISDVFTPELRSKMLDGFLDSKLAQPYNDGKIYLAPLYYSPSGLWYNQEYFKKNSLTPPVNWDDFFALKEKITDRSVFTYQGSHPSYLELMIIPAIASAAGSEAMDAALNYEAGAWENEKVIQVLDNIAKIGTGGYLLPGTPSMQFSEAQAEFLLGKAALIPNGTWFEGEMAESPREEAFVWGFSSAPVLDANTDKYVFTSCEEMYIPADAPNLELAKKFLAFQYSDAAVAANAELALGIPPVKGGVDKLKPYISEATYQAMLVFDNGYKPYVGNFAPVEGTEIIPKEEFFSKVSDAMAGKITGAEWAKYMEGVSEKVRGNIVK